MMRSMAGGGMPGLPGMPGAGSGKKAKAKQARQEGARSGPRATRRSATPRQAAARAGAAPGGASGAGRCRFDQAAGSSTSCRRGDFELPPASSASCSEKSRCRRSVRSRTGQRAARRRDGAARAVSRGISGWPTGWWSTGRSGDADLVAEGWIAAGTRRRALPRRPRRERRRAGRRRRAAGAGRPGGRRAAAAGRRLSPADTRWIDDRDDLPRIIRAGRHIARPKRYIRNYGARGRAGRPVGRRRAGRPRRGDGWVKLVGDWIDRDVGDLAPLWPLDALPRRDRGGARSRAPGDRARASARRRWPSCWRPASTASSTAPGSDRRHHRR